MHSEKLRGVNLGGWLLLEKWMTPALFQGTVAIDEYTLMAIAGARKKLTVHRKTFITEEDFRWLHHNGLNAIRIPIGYWALHDQSPYHSAVKYLDWAMDMAQKYSLQVIIDLHGLEGSQNGRDHSGRVGKSAWFNVTSYRKRSLQVLSDIATRYKDYDNFWGLQIINEPKLGLFHLRLRKYYHDASKLLADILHPHTKIIFSDGYTPRLMTGALKSSPHPVVMDVHLYHMTTLFSQYRSLDWFFKQMPAKKRFLQRLTTKQPVIIGEWSGLLRGEMLASLPEAQHIPIIQENIRLQLATYGATAGWFYWNYKTEKRGAWNFRSLVEDGIIEGF